MARGVCWLHKTAYSNTPHLQGHSGDMYTHVCTPHTNLNQRHTFLYHPERPTAAQGTADPMSHHGAKLARQKAATGAVVADILPSTPLNPKPLSDIDIGGRATVTLSGPADVPDTQCWSHIPQSCSCWGALVQ